MGRYFLSENSFQSSRVSLIARHSVFSRPKLQITGKFTGTIITKHIFDYFTEPGNMLIYLRIFHLIYLNIENQEIALKK